MRWITLLIALISFNSIAGIICEDNKFTIVFSKGANTSDNDAKDYVRLTKERIVKLFDEYGLSETIPINPDDIGHVILQNDEKSWVPYKISDLYNQYYALKDVTEYNDDGTIVVPEEHLTLLKDTFNHIHSQDEDLTQQLSAYKALLEGEYSELVGSDLYNSNLLVMAHSQGNMLYESIYNLYLRQNPGVSKDFRVLSMGSPVKLSHYDEYVMDKSDLLRPLNGFEWNTDNQIPFWNTIKGEGHSFIEYFNGVNESDNFKYGSAYKVNLFLVNSIAEMIGECKEEEEPIIITPPDPAYITITMEAPNDDVSLRAMETYSAPFPNYGYLCVGGDNGVFLCDQGHGYGSISRKGNTYTYKLRYKAGVLQSHSGWVAGIVINNTEVDQYVNVSIKSPVGTLSGNVRVRPYSQYNSGEYVIDALFHTELGGVYRNRVHAR